MIKYYKKTTGGMLLVMSIMLLWIGANIPASYALTFNIPKGGNVIGNIQYVTVRPGDNLSTLGRRFGIGGYEMKEANPGISYLRPKPGTTLVVPSRFVLPDVKRKGIVINLAEMRIYYFHPDGTQVSTFPVGIGKQGWNTPLGKTQIVRKRKDPTWVVPDSIIANYKRNGKHIERSVPPGPKNPLGKYAMNLGFENIVIHGTPYNMGIGVRSSHGCIRMWNSDVGKLFSLVDVGTPVKVLHQASKVGVLGNKVFLEVHVPISDPLYYEFDSVNTLIQNKANTIGRQFNVRWHDVERLRRVSNGYPQTIGIIK